MEKKGWFSIILTITTIVLSIIIAVIVMKVNPNNAYLETDGHNNVVISIAFDLGILVTLNTLAIFFLDYIRQPLYMLLYGVITTIVMFFFYMENGSVVSISNYIIIIIFYGMLVKDMKLTKSRLILQEALYITGFLFWIMLVATLFMYDNFHNPVNNSVLDKSLEYLFLSVIMGHLMLLLYKLKVSKKRNVTDK